jgi:transporter family protein
VKLTDIYELALLVSNVCNFFAGATAVLAKVGVSKVDPNPATAIRATVVLVLTWGLAFASAAPSALASISRRAWLFLTLSGLATGLSWLCYFRALQLGETSRVAPMDKLSAVFVIVFASLFLHEPLIWQHWVGGGFVVVVGRLYWLLREGSHLSVSRRLQCAAFQLASLRLAVEL